MPAVTIEQLDKAEFDLVAALADLPATATRMRQRVIDSPLAGARPQSSVPRRLARHSAQILERPAQLPAEVEEFGGLWEPL